MSYKISKLVILDWFNSLDDEKREEVICAIPYDFADENFYKQAKAKYLKEIIKFNRTRHEL